MEEQHLNSWAEFEYEIKKLERLQKEKSEKTSLRVAQLFFRGQSNSCWKLETTWERFCGDKTKLYDYYNLILSIKDELEAKTSRRWALPTLSQYNDWLETYISVGGGNGFPGYEYMSYLRHYGFPSPLLDWSKSPYVAAYFAFCNLDSKVEKVAIFAYLEHIGTKSGHAVPPSIVTRDKEVTTHTRHSLQQSCYSICTADEKHNAYFCCHEDVFSQGSKRQDFLWKFTLPISEQRHVLRKLETRGINAYSLFGSEESLLEMEFIREFFLKQA